MLGYYLREGVAENIFILLIRIKDLVYLDHKYLWAGSQLGRISTDKGDKSRFLRSYNVRKCAQGNFLNPRLGLVLPSIVAPLNGQVAPLDPWEFQEEFTAVDIYGYEVFNCFAFTIVTIGHAKRQLMYSILSELMAFLACHRDMNIY